MSPTAPGVRIDTSGNVLVGVQDDQTIVGLADDYADIKGKRADRELSAQEAVAYIAQRWP